MFAPRLTIAAAILSATAMAACSDATSAGARRPLSLSFSTAPAAAASATGTAAAVADELVITSAQVVMSEIELELGGASCADSSSSSSGSGSSDDDDCPEIKSGPVLVSLPLQGAATTALTVAVPAGTYRELELKIDAVESGDRGGPAFLTANPAFRGVSVRIEGTFQGQPFVYTSDIDEELELHFNPPLVVDGSNNNVTVSIDIAAWFRRIDGSVIDPRTATRGGVNESQVEENIKRSIRAFEDDDRDGHSDD